MQHPASHAHFYALIMAGGGGTRLWPLSRKTTPKQLLPLVEERSMFRVSVERLAPLFAMDHVYVVTGRSYVDALSSDTPQIPRENFIVEPYGKESGPAAALGIAVIQKRDPKAIVVILTADHHIADKERFRAVLETACLIAQRKNNIVTLGISPSIPSTGFGYIRRGQALRKTGGFNVYTSLGFTEKPNLETAVRFLASGEYSWNSGMFIWSAAKAMAEIQRQRPEWYALLQALHPHIDTPQYERVLDEVWEQIPKQSLDVAIMEHAQDMAVIPVDIGWSDVGSWDALFEVLELDDGGNGSKGASTNGTTPERIIIDTQNTLVYSDKLTVTIGVQDLVIVDTPDSLLICHRERAQDVKQVVQRLREGNYDRYL
ncbi:MAG: mannose-1-phosphate guanylyltransferase [bacterium]|nr:mannose-1-phosphate guanylyltransferase [bacterium]